MRIRSFIAVTAAILSALIFPALALANPSSETPEAATAGALAANSWETDTSPVTLSVYVDTPTQLRLTTFWGVDPVSVQWKEDTGIDLEWVIAPDDSQAKLNVLIASGDLPDLIHLSQELPQIRQLADNGLVWNIRELSENHAPGVWDYLWSRNKHMIVQFRTLFDSMDPGVFTPRCERSVNREFETIRDADRRQRGPRVTLVIGLDVPSAVHWP